MSEFLSLLHLKQYFRPYNMDSTLKLPLQHKVNMELGGRRSYIKIAEVEVPVSNPGYPHAGIPGVGRAHCLILHDIKGRLLKKF